MDFESARRRKGEQKRGREWRPHCDGKVRYHDIKQAKMALSQIRTRYVSMKAYYECHLCGGYHLTSKEQHG